jgi:hypothetical protein
MRIIAQATRVNLFDAMMAHAEATGIPLRTLDDVKATLAKAKETDADVPMARLMTRHGRLTDEAKAFVASYA